MTLHAPTTRRERTLVYGPSNAGKTTNVVDIARWIRDTSADSTIHFVNNDNSWEANDPGDLGNVVVPYEVIEWGDYKSAIKKALSIARPDDWLAVDMVGKLWPDTQDEYILRAYGTDMDEFFMSRLTRNEGEVTGSDFGGSYGINWQAINKMYTSVFGPLQRARCHVYCGSGAKTVSMPSRGGDDRMADRQEIRDLFGRIGMKPEGQKDLPYAFHTVLYQQEKKGGQGRVITTAKDRNRALLKGVELTEESGFVVKYLMGVAGWRP